MADIFLSYAREDLAWASRLATALAERGWSVFWDRRIPTGKSFDRVIEHELDAARCVVVLWSQHSISSDWVKGEASEGARRSILHPVWVEDVRIPLEFRRLQTARLVDWQPGVQHAEFDQLLADIGRTLATASSALTRTTGYEPSGTKAVSTTEAGFPASKPVGRPRQETEAREADTTGKDISKRATESRRLRAGKRLKPTPIEKSRAEARDPAADTKREISGIESV